MRCDATRDGSGKIMKTAIAMFACAAACLLATDASAAVKFKRFARCGDGLVTAKTCECHKAGSNRFEYCHAGHYCHTFDGTCRQ
jgi:hypothetical protein